MARISLKALPERRPSKVRDTINKVLGRNECEDYIITIKVSRVAKSKRTFMVVYAVQVTDGYSFSGSASSFEMPVQLNKFVENLFTVMTPASPFHHPLP